MAKQRKNTVMAKVSPLFGNSLNVPKVIELELELLDPNPDQPRQRFDEASLEELAESIRQHGLIQPITVKSVPRSKRWTIVAGERRVRAYQLLEKRTIFAITTTGNPEELALIENIQRENLHPIEEAEAYRGLMDRHGYNQEHLGKIVGKGRRTVNEILSLVSLPDSIRSECRSSGNWVPKSMLVELAREKDPEHQQTLWEKIRDGEITVREAKAIRKTPPDQTRATRTVFERVLSSGTSLQRRLNHLEKVSKDEQETLVHLKTELLAAFDRILSP